MTSEWRSIVLPGCDDVIAGDVIPVAMDRNEAQACMTRVKGHWQAFWFELKAFHDRRGWLALGYTSFKWCLKQELDISEARAYAVLTAADLRLELAALDVKSVDSMSVDQAMALKPLPPQARAEVARRTDFAETPVRQLRETVERAKIAIERLEDEDPNWDAVVADVVQDARVLDAKLKADYSTAVCRVTDRLLELDPVAVSGLLDEGDRLAALDFIGELRAWCARFEGALEQPLRLLPKGE